MEDKARCRAHQADHPGVALVHYPDGTVDEVEVPVTVKKQSDTFNPTAKEPNQNGSSQRSTRSREKY